MNTKKSSVKESRSSKTGRFVSKAFAKSHSKTTQTETIKRVSVKKIKLAAKEHAEQVVQICEPGYKQKRADAVKTFIAAIDWYKKQ